MGTIQTAKTVAQYIEPQQRGIAGCHNCTALRMMPSNLGYRRSECARLGCLVSPLAICDRYQAKTTRHTPIILDERTRSATSESNASDSGSSDSDSSSSSD